MDFSSQFLSGFFGEFDDLGFMLCLKFLDEISCCFLVIHHKVIPCVAEIHKMNPLFFFKIVDFMIMQNIQIIFPSF